MKTTLESLAAHAIRPGAPKADATAVHAALDALPGWKVEHGGLTKTYHFADWRAAMAFANRISDLANEVDHHPDLAVGWGRVQVAWSTHDAGGITGNDLACAARTEAIAARAGTRPGE
jgi:4a-hydroxytetrahydrobiopterin dehydratase